MKLYLTILYLYQILFDTGARNIDLIINTNIMPKLSKYILNCSLENIKISSIDLSIDDSNKISIIHN